MHHCSYADNDEWVEDYVERETTGARKLVEDAGAADQHVHDDMTHTQITGSTSRAPEKTFQEMLVAITDRLSDIASFDHGEDGEAAGDEETGQGKLGKDDKPDWVMGTITTMVEQSMDSFRPVQMMID